LKQGAGILLYKDKCFDREEININDQRNEKIKKYRQDD
jgi:hypothetical protein